MHVEPAAIDLKILYDATALCASLRDTDIVCCFLGVFLFYSCTLTQLIVMGEENRKVGVYVAQVQCVLLGNN
jgi:hypothetical protein